MQVGAEYVRHVSSLVKTSINSLGIASFPVASEERLSCLFHLKSSAEDSQVEPGTSICLRPETGDYLNSNSQVSFEWSESEILHLLLQDLADAVDKEDVAKFTDAVKELDSMRLVTQLCPTTVVPFFGDQFFWGDRIDQKGLGPAPIPISELNVQSLSDAIRFMLQPEVKSRVMEVAKLIENEDGVAAPVDAFHWHLPQEEIFTGHEDM